MKSAYPEVLLVIQVTRNIAGCILTIHYQVLPECQHYLNINTNSLFSLPFKESTDLDHKLFSSSQNLYEGMNKIDTL